MADPLGRALLGVEGGGPVGQLPELAVELLELPDARIEVDGVTLEQVGDMGAGGLAVVAEVVGFLSGFVVAGIVGVAGFPSCGVRRTLELSGALEAMAARPLATGIADAYVTTRMGVT